MKRLDPPQKFYDLAQLTKEFLAGVKVTTHHGQDAQQLLERYWPERFLALEVA